MSIALNVTRQRGFRPDRALTYSTQQQRRGPRTSHGVPHSGDKTSSAQRGWTRTILISIQKLADRGNCLEVRRRSLSALHASLLRNSALARSHSGLPAVRIFGGSRLSGLSTSGHKQNKGGRQFQARAHGRSISSERGSASRTISMHLSVRQRRRTGCRLVLRYRSKWGL